MNKTEQFFLYCSGVDRAMLDKCPTDVNKYVGIGATIFFTGLLAFFSSAYALYTVFESYIAATLFGIVWGAMIFNLDRYIVQSMKSYGKWYRDLMVALPRVALAVLLAVVISKPLELKIFEKEINAELIQMEQEQFKAQEDRVKMRFQSQIEQYAAEITQLKAEIRTKNEMRDTLSKVAVQEADGTGGSGQKNLGPIYRAKLADATKAQLELDATLALNQPLILEKEKAIEGIKNQVTAENAGLQRSKYDGFAARIDALSRLSGKSEAMHWASIFIMLLFIAIETAPILVKLISYRSPYDYLLHEYEQVFEMNNLEKTTLLSNATKNKVLYDSETGKYLVQARIQAEKAHIDAKLKENLENLRNRPFDWKPL